MQEVTLFFEKAGEKNYWCFTGEKIENNSFVGNGVTVRKAIENLYEAINEEAAERAKNGQQLPKVKFKYKMDVGSLFSYYPINITAFAKYIGMNASLLRQYASGLRTPKEKSLQKIREGLQKFKEDLDADTLIERPITSYI